MARCSDVAKRAKGYLSILRHSPHLLVAPLLLLGVSMGLGIWAVQAIAAQQTADAKNHAQQLAASTGAELATLFQQVFQPVATISQLVQTYTNWSNFEPSFQNVANSLFSQAPRGLLNDLAIAPNFVVAGSIPLGSVGIGVGLTNENYAISVLQVIAARQLSFYFGTDYPVGGPASGVPTMRLVNPVIISNVSEDNSFGLPPVPPCSAVPVCHGDVIPGLYDNATRSKVWGFVAAGVNVTSLSLDNNPSLQALVSSGYRFCLARDPGPGDSSTTDQVAITYTDPQPTDPVSAKFSIIPGTSAAGTMWEVLVSPDNGWTQVWLGPAIAVVVVVSLAASVLLLLLLLSRREHELLLKALVPAEIIRRVKAESVFLKGANEEAIDSSTPANKILSLIALLLDGGEPTARDLFFIRTAVLKRFNLYEPIDLEARMAATLDRDVQQALLHTLGTYAHAERDTYVRAGSHQKRRESSLGDSSPDNGSNSSPVPGAPTQSNAEEDYSSLQSGLESVLAVANEGCSAGPMCWRGPALLDHVLRRQLSSCTTLAAPRGSAGVPPFRAASNLGSNSSTVQTETLHGRRIGQLPPSASMPSTPQRRCSSGYSNGPAALPERASAALAPPLIDEVEAALATAANSWQFDAFHLDRVAGGHSLSLLGFFLMHDTGLIKRFKLPPSKLARFLCAVEAGYPDSPYHNSRHAASVLHTLHVLICKGGLMPGYVDSLTHLAAFLAAITHDFEHKGLTNEFLINSRDPLAITYNDRSPMENHHLAATFSLLMNPDYNFLSSLSQAEMSALRKMVIDMILSTDMKQHFSTTSHFAAVHRLHERPKSSGGNEGSYRQGKANLEVSELSHVEPIDEAERVLSLQMALKCADLGHTFAELGVHLQWVGCLEEEFFRQGDREKALDLPVSPLFDRNKPGCTKSQVGFYQFVVMPLFTNFAQVFKGCTPAVEFLTENLQYWQRVEQDARHKDQLTHTMVQVNVAGEAALPAASEPTSEGIV